MKDYWKVAAGGRGWGSPNSKLVFSGYTLAAAVRAITQQGKENNHVGTNSGWDEDRGGDPR
ncbi:MAG TPA: hypothetical protein VMU24_12135 [Candidatus Acidoferrales bacterium]|nr:hypothetical protein [Candidatus Acidoferrales bacterium]